MPATARADVQIDDFEDVSDWSGLALDATIFNEGAHSGLWDDHVSQTSVRKTFATPLDLSAADLLVLWVHSEVANGALIELIFDAEDPASAGWDYYRYRITVDWVGWRQLSIPRAAFSRARAPIGWHQINYVQLSASGWGHTALPDTVLRLDDLRATATLVAEIDSDYGYHPGGYAFDYEIQLSERLGQTTSIDVVATLDASSAWTASVTPSQLVLQPNQSATTRVRLELPLAEITLASALELEHATVAIRRTAGTSREQLELAVAAPLPSRPSPRLLLDAQDIGRIQTWSSTHAWAAHQVDAILGRADGWPDAHEAKYGLAQWGPPPEGGQWTLWYVCPTHGVGLRFTPPDRHECPVDGQLYTGWPYDEVIYSRRNRDAAVAAKDLGLAYQLRGHHADALAAAEILSAYAAVYESYAIHATDGSERNSGGRAMSQTLDESIWIVTMAWAYDLIAASGALTPAQAEAIERGLLRAAASVISRNDAGISNWQSWHNAGIAAVGFTLDDPRLQAQAIRGGSGFEFQMSASILPDGLWYEGSWGYHFFALDALLQTALMAEAAGLDPFSQPELRRMLTMPVGFSMPDMTLPAFNDSGTISLRGNRSHYEIGYAQYRDAAMLAPLVDAPRTERGLLWGAEHVPLAAPVSRGSEVFDASGFAVLRAGAGDDEHYIALDYGEHGGWHGHYDKLGFVSYARGTIMGVDPGTQSYAAPTHDTWDKVTVAHNTLVVDEASQAEATGALVRAVLLPEIGFARATAGDAYSSASLHRQMALTSDYILDLFEARALDGAVHDYDLVYHNAGTATVSLPLTPYNSFGTSDGYQHLTDTSATRVDVPFAVDFDVAGGREPSYGSVWTNNAAISGAFTIAHGHAVTGTSAGRLAYDFGASGYALFSTEPAPGLTEVPEALALWLYGDSSGHELSVRVMAATGERLVRSLGTIRWSGWRRLRADGITSWSHYLGNDDGILDTPVGSVVVQLRANTSSSAGELFVDDIELEYAQAGVSVVADFERPLQATTWHVLGEVGTTLVLGLGLGPDLRVPVPFAMVRRSAQDTDFVSLYEPHEHTPQITAFDRLAVTGGVATDATLAVSIASSQWQDWLHAVGEGDPGVVRSAGGYSCDGVLCYVRLDAGRAVVKIAVAEATSLTDGLWPLVVAPGGPVSFVATRDGGHLTIAGDLGGAEVQVHAPTVMSVSDDDGGLVSWHRQGDYVVLNPMAAPDAGVSTPDAGAGDATSATGADASISGDASNSADASTPADASSSVDASTPADASSSVDASTNADATTADDASNSADATSSPDASNGADATTADASTDTDASSSADASNGADAADASTDTDASSRVDASKGVDAAILSDASASADATSSPDASASPDATSPADGAGLSDADDGSGAPDADPSGGNAGLDLPDAGLRDRGSGPTRDATPAPAPEREDGCSCGAVPASPVQPRWLVSLVLLPLALRRRPAR